MSSLVFPSASANLYDALAIASGPRDGGERRDRRIHVRLTGAELSWLNAVKLKYGPSVSLIDLSAGGTQIETTSYKLNPGATVVLEFEGDHGDFAIPARVLRCEVSGLLPCTTYRGALLFKRHITLPSLDGTGEGPAHNAVHEHARLCITLQRFYELHGRQWGSDGITSVAASTLGAPFGILESSSSRRRANASLTGELGRLFRAVALWVDGDSSLDALLGEITQRLRRSIPTRTIRLLDVAPATLQSADTVYFDIPSGHGTANGKLAVQLRRGARLDEWHLTFLKAVAQLVAITQDVERIRLSAEQHSRNQTTARVLGWHRLVARYTDGRSLDGFGYDFSPTRGFVQIWPTRDSNPDACTRVPLQQLQSLLLVNDSGADVTDAASLGGGSSSGAGRRSS